VILEALQARETRDYRHMYAQEDEPQAWEDLIGCIASQGEEDAQYFDGAFGRRVAVPVAVHGAGRHPGIHFIIYVLAAN
jgi:hypothetical protein